MTALKIIASVLLLMTSGVAISTFSIKQIKKQNTNNQLSITKTNNDISKIKSRALVLKKYIKDNRCKYGHT
jgi:uncharacterized membrane protein